jgi:hypothetical protein
VAVPPIVLASELVKDFLSASSRISPDFAPRKTKQLMTSRLHEAVALLIPARLVLCSFVEVVAVTFHNHDARLRDIKRKRGIPYRYVGTIWPDLGLRIEECRLVKRWLLRHFAIHKVELRKWLVVAFVQQRDQKQSLDRAFAHARYCFTVLLEAKRLMIGALANECADAIIIFARAAHWCGYHSG